ncbi:hypothetical protein Tco_0709521 [Tanacetum coccineum]
MAYFVAILTPDSIRSCVMQSTFPTKGMRSIISTVSISLEGFLASILLLMVVIVAAVIVTVIRVVVVVVIFGVVIVVVIIGVIVVVMIIGIVVVVRIIGIVVVGGGVPFIIKLSFVRFSWAYAFHQDKASSVRVPVANVTLFSLAQLLRENIDSVRISLGSVSYWDCRHLPWQQLVLPGAAAMPHYQLPDDTEMSDSIGGLVSLGDEIFSEGKESRELNIGGGEKTSMSKRYLVKSSEDLGETFLGEAGK